MVVRGWKRYRPTTKYHYFHETTSDGSMWSLCRLWLLEANEVKEQDPPMDKRCKICQKRFQELEESPP